jgi:hypothetical protein
MSESKIYIVNSDQSYIDFDKENYADYQEHKYQIITVRFGRDRTLEQNKLQRKWLKEAKSQGDQTEEEYRGYCKLHFGVPIMRNSNEDFREIYDRLIRPLDYEDKLKLMMVPMDLPVTRLMSRQEKGKYLDDMYQHFTGLGFKLTIPKKEK